MRGARPGSSCETRATWEISMRAVSRSWRLTSRAGGSEGTEVEGTYFPDGRSMEVPDRSELLHRLLYRHVGIAPSDALVQASRFLTLGVQDRSCLQSPFLGAAE